MLRYEVAGSQIRIESELIRATIQTVGYTSGVMAGSFLDKTTGARDLGFGLSITDFLLEPTTLDKVNQPGQYEIAPKQPAHGKIPKRYVEGPQICTQAGRLPFEIAKGPDFLVVRLWYKFHQAYPPYQAGSRWEQTLVFPENARYFFSADRVTSVNDHPALILRMDTPGHIKHARGDTFHQVYLSYLPDQKFIPSREFQANFGPDERFLYRRPLDGAADNGSATHIRGYQPIVGGKPGPWLAALTLEPDDVYEAWCHQRGYICMIQEIGGRPVKAGGTFGACSCIGWFDHLEEMEAVYESFRGWSGLTTTGPINAPTEFVGVKQSELPPVRAIAANPA